MEMTKRQMSKITNVSLLIISEVVLTPEQIKGKSRLVKNEVYKKIEELIDVCVSPNIEN